MGLNGFGWKNNCNIHIMEQENSKNYEFTLEEKACIQERVRQYRSGRPVNPSQMYDELYKKYPTKVSEYTSTLSNIQK